jgi:hypothetical protein
MIRKQLTLLIMLVLVGAAIACGVGSQQPNEPGLGHTPTPPPIPTDVDLTPTPNPSATPTIEPIGELSPVPTEEANSPDCTNRVELVSDVTVPDNARMSPNAAFTKIWRLRNSGTCTWNSGYAVVYAGGHNLNGPTTQTLSQAVRPVETVDVSLSLTAPGDDGTYRAEWLLRSGDGTLFGLGRNADRTFWVQIVVQRPANTTPGPTPTVRPSATPTSSPTSVPSITHWRGEYYRGRSPSGSPTLVRDDVSIDFNWASTSPDTRLPADNFSARWSRTLRFDAGLYRFHAAADDGIRVWLDGSLIIDAWRDSSFREHIADLTVARGNHTVVVEYYERSGDARVAVSWALRPQTFTEWKGEYWSNKDQRGDPVLIRNDTSLNFNWGANAPANGVPANNFSARWTRKVHFESGTYRFQVSMDDGARLWIDDRLVLDAWTNGSVRVKTADVTLSTGNHNVRVDYFENGGDAVLRMSWTRLSTPTPTSTATPTRTPTVTPTVAPATLTPTVIPTTITPTGDSSIGGVIWQDVCAKTGMPPGEDSITEDGCVVGSDGNLWGDGVQESDEPLLQGIVVALSFESCLAEPFAFATTDSDGFYDFDELQPGIYCVMVPTIHPTNEMRLLPGVWTYPDRTGTAIVTLTAGGDRTLVNFGWDFELQP